MTHAFSTVRLPARALAALADRCGEIGPRGVAALHEAGRVAGEALLERLGRDPGSAAPGEFWTVLGKEFEDLGLGPLAYRVHGPALGEVRLGELPEATGDGERDREHPGCPFSTGLLGGLLSGVAGEPVPVLEVACRAGGAAACRFLVGNEDRLAEVRDALAGGASPDEALAGG